MTPLWTLQNQPAPAHITLTENQLILENRYIRRIIDLTTGITTSITDSEGVDALSAPLREGSVSVA